jgi:hypothetical protein
VAARTVQLPEQLQLQLQLPQLMECICVGRCVVTDFHRKIFFSSESQRSLVTYIVPLPSALQWVHLWGPLGARAGGQSLDGRTPGRKGRGDTQWSTERPAATCRRAVTASVVVECRRVHGQHQYQLLFVLAGRWMQNRPH